MMHTSYRVTSRTGELLGIFQQGNTSGLKALVDANPGSDFEAVVTIDNPCSQHPAFEADYCPGCGTEQVIR